ncbi:EAL domain-containing protein [Agromyces sp. G08B096]|uniref:EAL domain-containing protein n=1 Tax=Agromyces sp. G08B096 TaxID=3156399 RepID=A0AAU7WAZ6_9MICO
MRSLESALRGAVDRDEIFAVFQPQVDLATGRVVGAEALCRWKHPEWGLIPPDEFIPVAEDTGLIDEIGRYMAEQCCRALAEWSTPEDPIDLSVNVSPVQLETREFTEWLVQCLRRYTRQGGVLTLEITESRAVTDIAPVLRRLGPLRAIGVGIAVDDLGTGHASITQLRRLHGTEVKLDRTLVGDDSPEALKTMSRAVDVAHRSGIRVVAEGIETEEQLERVRRLGCDRGQGWLLGRPMSGEGMHRLVRSRP